MTATPNYDYGDPLTLSQTAGDAATNSTRLAAACGAGKAVFVTRPGTYYFSYNGAGYATDSLGRTFRKCVDLGNLRLLRGAPGVVFKLADSQMQNTGDTRGPCSILCSDAPTDLMVQNIRFDGNTAGQTSWTGAYNANLEKWTQLDGSMGLLVSCLNGSYGRVTVEDCYFYDFFANPWLADGNNTYRGGQFIGRRIWYGDCGEGGSVDDSSDADLEDITFVADAGTYTASDASTKNKTAGDGLETARTRRVRIKNYRTWTRQGTVLPGGGGCIDYGGAESVEIDTVYCKHWQAGTGGDISATIAPKCVTMRNHTYIDVPQTAIQLEYPADYILDDISSYNCGHHITASGSSAARTMTVLARNQACYLGGTILNLRGDIRFQGERMVYRGTGNAITCTRSATYLGTPFIYGDRWDLYSTSAYGIYLNGASLGAYAPTVTVKGSYVNGAAGASLGANDGATTNVTITA